tara:strand:+ start:1774 stop:2613 length:840 start_codon:yes stop_codon:yes gene_type:complete
LEEQRDPNHPHICTIERVVDETPTVRTLYFHDSVLDDVLPGQFAMVWIPGVNELPMSVMVGKDHFEVGFTVRKRGESSTALYNLKVGDKIGVRGPYGNSFDIKADNTLLLIGGGTGLVPLMRLIKYAGALSDYTVPEITVLMGSRTKEEVFFEKVAKELTPRDSYVKVISVTEDGSYGEKGYVTDVLEKLLEENTYDAIYTCGPELMMYKVVKLANEKGIFVQASLERMMKCGVGICGSCCVNEDLVCRDGTVFDGQHLAKSSEFGHFQRTKSGILEEI